MNSPDPGVVRQRLLVAGIRGVDEFHARLASNAQTEVYRDLLAEAAAAMTLREAGFDVEMRDRPDLALVLAGQSSYAEVKHFRRKPQDDVDDRRMAAYGGRLVTYGDTTASEGKAAVHQVLAVIRKKLSQLREGAPNLMILQSSSSNCIEDYEVADVMPMIADAVVAGSEEFRLLNGVLFLSPSYNCRLHTRVYFFPTSDPVVPLAPEMHSLLEQIRDWNYQMFDPG